MTTPIDTTEFRAFHENGFVQLRHVFTQLELDIIDQEIDTVIRKNGKGLVWERNTQTIRGIQGPHLESRLLANLARDRRLLQTAEILLEGNVYIHQYKINFKAPFVGGVWPWHQDYPYWHYLDGIPDPKLISVVVALDDVTEFNGPLMFIPGSHRNGILESSAEDPVPQTGDWRNSFSSDLPYQLSTNRVQSLIGESQIISPKGTAGSILAFDACIAHASLPNLSPFQRRLLLITYNRVDNCPSETRNRREEFICGRDTEALAPVRTFIEKSSWDSPVLKEGFVRRALSCLAVGNTSPGKDGLSADLESDLFLSGFSDSPAMAEFRAFLERYFGVGTVALSSAVERCRSLSSLFDYVARRCFEEH
jgi:hypothetical protein